MSERRVIPGSEKRRMTGARVIGPTDPRQVVEVSIYLKPHGGKAGPDVAARVSTRPADARVHVGREEYEREFGASGEDIARIETFARAHGLEVVAADADQRRIVVSGPSQAIAAAFGTELQEYEHPQIGRFRGRVGAISVPTEIGSLVEGVVGLDDRRVAEPRLQRRESFSTGGAMLPTEVATLYGFPKDVTGKGQTIAIVELGGGYRLTELHTYFKRLGVTPMPKVTAVSVDQGKNHPGIDVGADGEVLLDIEVAAAVAPAAHVVVYFAPNTDRGFLDAINRAVHDKHNRPSVISISWGSAEASWTAQSLRLYDQAFAAASALGVTICAAAGDAGSTDGMTDGLQHVDFPASSPYVLACGGTRLVGQGGRIQLERVWNNDPRHSATGGGVSDAFDVPAWQSDLGAKLRSQNPGDRIGRGVPDVAGNADPATGYRVLVDGQDEVIGGTSAVAPLWAGLVALINEKRASNGNKPPVGYLQPLLYASKAAGLRDVPSGSGNNGAYASDNGWDACTGLGSPDGAALAKLLG